MKVRVIKSHITMVQTLKTPAELDYYSDRAIADYRGFQHTASLHAERVQSPMALTIMEEIVEGLSQDLKKRRLQML